MMSMMKIIQKKGKEKITMLTAYDYLIAKIISEVGIDIILVGDSLGTVVLGYKNTIPVKIEDILRHTIAVRNGAPDSFIVADMPFLTYGINIDESILNAGVLIKEGGANAVKLEGGKEICNIIESMVNIGIPVMGHIGLKPQSINKTGLKVVGKNEKEIEDLLSNANALEKAGVFSIVLEEVTEEAAKIITENINIPTIGIGSGRFTDGQVLVITDMLGIDKNINLKHNKKYANLYDIIYNAIKNYKDDVVNGNFPTEENVFHFLK